MIINCPSCGQPNRVPEQLGSGAKAVCGKCKAELPVTGAGDGDGHPVTLDDAGFTQQIGSGKWLVDFWAPWCGPCRMIAPVLDELASQRSDIRVGKLNVDHNQRTAVQYRAMSIPLLVFFEDGVEKGRVVGAVPKGHIEAAIKQYLGG
jgi:thioredoxin 1